MICGMLSLHGCVKLELLLRKHLCWGHLCLSMCQKLTVFKEKDDDILNHESVLVLYVLVSLALGVSQYLYSALV